MKNNQNLLFVLAFNLFLLVDFLVEPGNSGQIMLLFWFQSILIGLSNVIQMFALKQIKPFSVNGELRTDRGVRIQMGIFFLFHYGIFHFVYLVFIAVFNARILLAGRNWTTILLGFGLLFLGFVSALPGQIKFNRGRQMDIGLMFFSPYLRVIPMHAAILAGAYLAGGNNAFLLFLILKTGVDLVTEWMYGRKWEQWHPPVGQIV